MTNTAYIYQPHFNTECFRVASNSQQGTVNNYIIVTCSPMYNGVWKYSANKALNYSHWKNGNIDCLCVPIVDCVKIKNLNQIINQTVINKIIQQQQNWYKNQVKNRNYEYVNKPEWFLERRE